mmetsp:Transcript_9844/g.20891  ORF Transcript_9844/g.20891 Transcript_9844/m.20891 type:complete len:334 (-) Transcript_9844:35-1036(-)
MVAISHKGEVQLHRWEPCRHLSHDLADLLLYCADVRAHRASAIYNEAHVQPLSLLVDVENSVDDRLALLGCILRAPLLCLPIACSFACSLQEDLLQLFPRHVLRGGGKAHCHWTASRSHGQHLTEAAPFDLPAAGGPCHSVPHLECVEVASSLTAPHPCAALCTLLQGSFATARAVFEEVPTLAHPLTARNCVRAEHLEAVQPGENGPLGGTRARERGAVQRAEAIAKLPGTTAAKHVARWAVEDDRVDGPTKAHAALEVLVHNIVRRRIDETIRQLAQQGAPRRHGLYAAERLLKQRWHRWGYSDVAGIGGQRGCHRTDRHRSRANVFLAGC